MSVGGAEGPTQITLQGKGVKKKINVAGEKAMGGQGTLKKKTLILRKISPKGKKIARKFQKILSFFSVLIYILPFHQSKYFLQYSFLQTDLAIERLFETPHTIWGDLGRPRDSKPPQNKALFTFWVVPARGGQIWTLSSVGFLLYKKTHQRSFLSNTPTIEQTLLDRNAHWGEQDWTTGSAVAGYHWPHKRFQPARAVYRTSQTPAGTFLSSPERKAFLQLREGPKAGRRKQDFSRQTNIVSKQWQFDSVKKVKSEKWFKNNDPFWGNKIFWGLFWGFLFQKPRHGSYFRGGLLSLIRVFFLLQKKTGRGV